MHKRKGAFVISIDYEYAWGFTDWNLTEEDFERMRGEVAITKRLIALFEKYSIPATWAIVGNLLQLGSRGRDVVWYDAENLIKKIATSPVGHEIGSHSFEHTLFSEVSKDIAIADIQQAYTIHQTHNFSFHSFIFPRNKEGYHAVLREYGLRAYRGVTSMWYSKLPKILRPLWRGIDFWLPTAYTHTPTVHTSGLLNIPDSFFFITRRGLQKLLPPSRFVRKVEYGLTQAIKRGEVFHLWFHPSNFSYDTETQFAIFEDILRSASVVREKGQLSILTMQGIAEQYKNV